MASTCRRCRREPPWCSCTAAELAACDVEARQHADASSPVPGGFDSRALVQSAKIAAACAAAVFALTVGSSGSNLGSLANRAATGIGALFVLGGPVLAVVGLILAAVKRDAQLAWAVVGAVAGFCVAYVILMMVFAAI